MIARYELIMINSIEIGSESVVNETSTTADVTYECDWCGRPVRPETAGSRSAGDAEGVVLLCAQCEFGTE